MEGVTRSPFPIIDYFNELQNVKYSHLYIHFAGMILTDELELLQPR